MLPATSLASFADGERCGPHNGRNRVFAPPQGCGYDGDSSTGYI
jgi:hypothetical protein